LISHYWTQALYKLSTSYNVLLSLDQLELYTIILNSLWIFKSSSYFQVDAASILKHLWTFDPLPRNMPRTSYLCLTLCIARVIFKNLQPPFKSIPILIQDSHNTQKQWLMFCTLCILYPRFHILHLFSVSYMKATWPDYHGWNNIK